MQSTSCSSDRATRSSIQAESASQLLAKGQRVHVRPHDGPAFDGTIERVVGSDGVTCRPCYLVRRDKSIVVYGFIRNAYWAPATRVELIAAQADETEPFDHARFEAQR